MESHTAPPELSFFNSVVPESERVFMPLSWQYIEVPCIHGMESRPGAHAGSLVPHEECIAAWWGPK